MEEERLLQLKEELEELKSEVSRLEGKQQTILENLKEQFGCSSIADAEKLLSTMDEEIQQLQEKIDKQLEKIEEKYEEF